MAATRGRLLALTMSGLLAALAPGTAAASPADDHPGPTVADGAVADSVVPSWAQMIEPLGRAMGIVVDAANVTHVTYQDETSNTAWYATDAGGTWIAQRYSSWASGVAVDADGTVYLLGYELNTDMPGLYLYDVDDTGTVAKLGRVSTAQNLQAALATGPGGIVNIAWGGAASANAFFRTYGPTGWSDTATLAIDDTTNYLQGVDVVVDGAGVAHVIASGAYGDNGTVHLAGCALPALECTVDFPMDEPSNAIAVATYRGMVDAAVDGDGHIDVAIRRDNGDLYRASNAGGPWAVEQVATGTQLAFAIAETSGGPVIVTGSTSGLVREDRGSSGWTSTPLTTGNDQHVAATADTSGNLLIAFSRVGWHDPWGYVGDLYVLPPDTTPPVISGVKAAATGSTRVGSTVTTRVSWAASDDLSGIARYLVQQSTNGGSWKIVASSLTTTHLDRTLILGSTTYRFRVQAWDRSGNASPVLSGPSFHINKIQESSSAITYHGSWTRVTGSGLSGGKARYATSHSATAAITFSGSGVSLVTTKARARGKVQVLLDGKLIGTWDLHASKTHKRIVALTVSWPVSGRHTVRFRPVGSGSHPRIDLDALLLIR